MRSVRGEKQATRRLFADRPLGGASAIVRYASRVKLGRFHDAMLARRSSAGATIGTVVAERIHRTRTTAQDRMLQLPAVAILGAPVVSSVPIATTRRTPHLRGKT